MREFDDFDTQLQCEEYYTEEQEYEDTEEKQ